MRLLLLIYFSLSIIKLSFAQDDISWFIDPADGYEYEQFNYNGYYLISKGEQHFFKHKDGDIYPTPSSRPRSVGKYWKFTAEGLTGLWSPEKGEIIPPIYDDISLLSDSTFYVRKYGMYAIINIKNELLLPYENYNYIKRIGQHILSVRSGKKQKWFDVNGDTIPRYGAKAVVASTFGYYRVVFDDGLSLMDRKGNLLLEERYDDVQLVHDTFIYIKNKEKRGLLNMQKEEVVPMQFEELSFIYVDKKHQAYLIKENGKYGILTLDGQKKRMGEFDKITSYGNYLLVEKDNKLGCLNPVTLDIDIPPAYDKKIYRSFRCANPVQFVKTDSGYIFKNLEKNITLPIAFHTINQFKHGLAKVKLKKKGNWALLNEEGELVTGYIFRSIGAKEFPVYSAVDTANQKVLYLADGTTKAVPENVVKIQSNAREGLVIFRDAKNKYGFMNEKCDIIIPAIFDTAKGFIKGLAEVKYQGKWGLIKHPFPAD